MSEVQYTVRDAINRLKAANALGKTNLSGKGVDLPGEENTTYEVVDGIEDIEQGGGGGIEYSSVDYDEATKTYTLTEKDDPTITHTLTYTYDAQGRINGMVYDSKAIAVTYNNDGTVTVGGTVVDVSEFPNEGVGFNIAFDTQNPPTDTSKLWVKATQPQNVTVDYDIDNGVESVQALTAVLPVSTWERAVGAVSTKCYIFVENILCVLDSRNDTISTTTLPLNVPKRSAYGVVGTKIYIFGGYDGSGHTADIKVFDTEAPTISTLQTPLPQAATDIACGVVGTKCYLFGGYHEGYLDTINVFDTETNTITTLTTTLPTAAQYIACGVIGTKIYLFGGFTNGGETNAIQKFTVTFPLAEGDIYLQSDVFKNKFTLLTEPTELETGVSAVYVGNAQNEAENAEAYLHNGTQWRQI